MEFSTHTMERMTLKDVLDFGSTLNKSHGSRFDKLVVSHKFDYEDDATSFFEMFLFDKKSFMDDTMMPYWTDRTKVTGFQTLIHICTECVEVKEYLERKLSKEKYDDMIVEFKHLVKYFTRTSRKPKTVVQERESSAPDHILTPGQCSGEGPSQDELLDVDNEDELSDTDDERDTHQETVQIAPERMVSKQLADELIGADTNITTEVLRHDGRECANCAELRRRLNAALHYIAHRDALVGEFVKSIM